MLLGSTRAFYAKLRQQLAAKVQITDKNETALREGGRNLSTAEARGDASLAALGRHPLVEGLNVFNDRRTLNRGKGFVGVALTFQLDKNS